MEWIDISYILTYHLDRLWISVVQWRLDGEPARILRRVGKENT